MTRRKATPESIMKRQRIRKRTLRRMIQKHIRKQVAIAKRQGRPIEL